MPSKMTRPIALAWKSFDKLTSIMCKQFNIVVQKHLYYILFGVTGKIMYMHLCINNELNDCEMS